MSYNPPQPDITPQTDRVYKINKSEPGIVIIFNNKEFKDDEAHPIRHVSEQKRV